MIDVTRKHFSSSSTSITSENVLVVRDLDKMSISDFINALEEYDFKNTIEKGRGLAAKYDLYLGKSPKIDPNLSDEDAEQALMAWLDQYGDVDDEDMYNENGYSYFDADVFVDTENGHYDQFDSVHYIADEQLPDITIYDNDCDGAEVLRLEAFGEKYFTRFRSDLRISISKIPVLCEMLTKIDKLPYVN